MSDDDRVTSRISTNKVLHDGSSILMEIGFGRQRPSGLTMTEAGTLLAEACAAAMTAGWPAAKRMLESELVQGLPVQTSSEKQVPASIQPRQVAGVKTSTLEPSATSASLTPIGQAALVKAQFTSFREGHPRAGWCKIDRLPADVVEALKAGPVTVGDYVYRLSGCDGRLVARNPVASSKTSGAQ